MELTTTLLNQSVRAFRVTLECQEVLKDIQMSNHVSIEKLVQVEEETIKEKAEAELLAY